MLNDALVKYVVTDTGLDDETVYSVIESLTKAVLFFAVCKGAIDTPIGKVAMGTNGLEILEQNSELMRELAGSTSPTQVHSKLSKMILG